MKYLVAKDVKVKKVGDLYWIVPVNEKGEEDWICPKCGGTLHSCCGNSHIWCYNCGFELWDRADFLIELILQEERGNVNEEK